MFWPILVMAAGAAAAYLAVSRVTQAKNLRDHVLVPRGLDRGAPPSAWECVINGRVCLDKCATHGYAVGRPPPGYQDRWLNSKRQTSDPGIPEQLLPFHPDPQQRRYTAGGATLSDILEARTHDEGEVPGIEIVDAPPGAGKPIRPGATRGDTAQPEEEGEWWEKAQGEGAWWVAGEGWWKKVAAAGPVPARIAAGGVAQGDVASSLPASVFGLVPAWPPAQADSRYHREAWMYAHTSWRGNHPEPWIWVLGIILGKRNPALTDLWQELGCQWKKPGWEFRQKGGLVTKPPAHTDAEMAWAYAYSCAVAACLGWLERPDVIPPYDHIDVKPALTPPSPQSGQPSAAYGLSAKAIDVLGPAMIMWSAAGGGFKRGPALAAGIGLALGLGKESYKLLSGSYGPKGAEQLLLPSWEPVAVPMSEV